jgi:hypothetical protein
MIELTKTSSRPNQSSPFSPPKLTNVTHQKYQNVYEYDRRTLWISYGLAIAFTALAICSGVVAIVSNGASYSNAFSTIFRVSRTAGGEINIYAGDGAGHDPLPGYLKLARLNLYCDTTDAGKYELLEVPDKYKGYIGEGA